MSTPWAGDVGPEKPGVRPRGEPRYVSLADLMVFVAGFAVMASVARAETDVTPYLFPNGAPPFWVRAAWHLAGWVWKATLPLGIVALVRRVRYGGWFGPGEFAVLASGLHLLAYDFHSLLGAAFGGGTFVNGSLGVQLLIVLAAVAATREAVRHARPGWWTGLVLSVAWAGLGVLLSLLTVWVLMSGSYLWGFNPELLLLRAATNTVARVVSLTPLVVALRSARRRGFRSRPWTEPAGVGLCLLAWVASEVRTAAFSAGSARGNVFAFGIALAGEAVAEVIAWSISYVLVRRYGPAVARRILPPAKPPAAELEPDPYAPPAS